MNIAYDKESNAAYISFKSKIADGEVKNTYCCDINETGGMFNLDFDKDGRLIGIEILDAEKKLPEEILRGAK